MLKQKKGMNMFNIKLKYLYGNFIRKREINIVINFIQDIFVKR